MPYTIRSHVRGNAVRYDGIGVAHNSAAQASVDDNNQSKMSGP